MPVTCATASRGKTVTGDFGEIQIAVPRDRAGSFEPQLIPKHQRRFPGFDDRVLSLYARGMTNREIAAHLQELFGAEVSPSLISAITDTVSDEVRAWQARPLDALYPILYLDCLMVKSRDHGSVGNRAIYLAIGVNTDGMKEVLGLRSAPAEGAKFWLSVVTELKNRGVRDILIACVDGLKRHSLLDQYHAASLGGRTIKCQGAAASSQGRRTLDQTVGDVGRAFGVGA